MITERIKLGARLSVSIVCFIIVFNFIDIHIITNLIKDIEIDNILLATLFMLLGHIGSSLRFHFITNRLNRKLSVAEALKVSFVALWFNQILPTGMGGDVVRIIMLAKTCGRARIILSALLDRAFGLLWMVVMILFFAPLVLAPKLGVEACIVIAFASFIALLIGFSPMWLGRRLCTYIKNEFLLRICRFFVLLGHAMRRVVITKQVYKLVLYLALSFFPYVLYVSILGHSFELELSLLEYIAVVPVIFIAMQFPVSVGGWGVRELASIYVFSYLGISEEVAVIISVLYGFGLLITSTPGNLFWIRQRNVAKVVTA